jgi:hypothetical protein
MPTRRSRWREANRIGKRWAYLHCRIVFDDADANPPRSERPSTRHMQLCDAAIPWGLIQQDKLWDKHSDGHNSTR